jgi:hypothetical protein
MTSFLGSQDQTWFGSLRSTGGSTAATASVCPRTGTAEACRPPVLDTLDGLEAER